MTAGRTAATVLALIAAGVGLWFIRSATLSRDVAMPPRSRTEVVFAVATRHLEKHTVEEAAAALFHTCRLTVESTVEQPPTQLGVDTFRAVVAPALDRTDRLQLRGCIEDLQIAHVLGDVVRIGDP